MLHVYFAFVIAWLIVDIECTIRWNNITNVDTVNTTGQLIPLVVGCISAADTFKSLMLVLLGNKYPSWKHTTLEVENRYIIGPASFRITKRDETTSRIEEFPVLIQGVNNWPSEASDFNSSPYDVEGR
ncbi:unnamed protein product [Clonostachys solani]|uniref:Uncharacterized protein n=1 Tax=Clonostachys solani TaxID=160281 RepID=A0A9N9Z891_9HYPO|nr:unnamed protein product [Clonostachys solani]